MEEPKKQLQGVYEFTNAAVVDQESEVSDLEDEIDVHCQQQQNCEDQQIEKKLLLKVDDDIQQPVLTEAHIINGEQEITDGTCHKYIPQHQPYYISAHQFHNYEPDNDAQEGDETDPNDCAPSEDFAFGGHNGSHFPGLVGLGLTPLLFRRHHGNHDPNKRHTWTGEEDRRLKELIQTIGPRKWGVIATHFKNRNAKQCHQRWHYVLKPSITREPWTEAEDQAILHYQVQIGNKWSHIAKFLPGRTGYAIRNRYNFLSKRQLEEAQRHLRPFLGPPLSLQMYVAAAQAQHEHEQQQQQQQQQHQHQQQMLLLTHHHQNHMEHASQQEQEAEEHETGKELLMQKVPGEQEPYINYYPPQQQFQQEEHRFSPDPSYQPIANGEGTVLNRSQYSAFEAPRNHKSSESALYSVSPLDAAAFANLELMATAAGQQQQVQLNSSCSNSENGMVQEYMYNNENSGEQETYAV